MRLVIVIAAALGAAPVAAQSGTTMLLRQGNSAGAAEPSGGVTLGPNEVLLEVISIGTAHTRVDLIEVLVPVLGRGSTVPAAREANRGLGERLIAAARAAGVAAADIEVVSPPQGRIGFVGNEAYEMMTAQAEPPARVYTNSLKIRLRDAGNFNRLRTALEAAGATQVGDPVFSLADDSSARRAAKADGVRKAREEAEAYARALGMRVFRIVRISEGAGSSVYDFENMEQMFRAMSGLDGGQTGDLETNVKIAVDFAIGPG